MLVLSRREKQKIIINDHITVTILRISPKEVRIGINAPGDIPVHREEIYENIKNEMKKRPDSNFLALRKLIPFLL